MNCIQGQRVKITHTSNEFAASDVGKTGTVIGEAPLGMVTLLLDDGREYWADPYNLAKVGA